MLGYEHFADGGTMVTNFHIRERYKYQTAVNKFNEIKGKEILKVDDKAFGYEGTEFLANHGSLHMIKNVYDLTEFWKIFDSL